MFRTLLLSVIAVGVVVIAAATLAPDKVADLQARILEQGPSVPEAQKTLDLKLEQFGRTPDLKRISAIDCTHLRPHTFNCALTFSKTDPLQHWIFIGPSPTVYKSGWYADQN